MAEERLPLNLPSPDQLKAREVKWIVVTPENFDSIVAELAQEGQPLVLFAITPNGYEQLSLTMAEIRHYILTQRTIIIRYKDYYESSKNK